MNLTKSSQRMFGTVVGAVAAISFVPAQVAGRPSVPVSHSAKPAQLLGVAFSPTRIEPGKTVKLYIRLTHPAPMGGFEVTLISTRPKDMPLPRVITIPKGLSSLGLSITLKTKISGPVAVRATGYGSAGSTQSKAPNHTATLQVSAKPNRGSK